MREEAREAKIDFQSHPPKLECPHCSRFLTGWAFQPDMEEEETECNYEDCKGKIKLIK